MTLAICVSWGVFCEYWDDFCYPASDDVAIWSLSQEWFLIYDHSGEVFLRKVRPLDNLFRLSANSRTLSFIPKITRLTKEVDYETRNQGLLQA